MNLNLQDEKPEPCQWCGKQIYHIFDDSNEDYIDLDTKPIKELVPSVNLLAYAKRATVFYVEETRYMIHECPEES